MFEKFSTYRIFNRLSTATQNGKRLLPVLRLSLLALGLTVASVTVSARSIADDEFVDDVVADVLVDEGQTPSVLPDNNDLSSLETVKGNYTDFPYIRILKEDETPNLSDEEFYDIAGKMMFPVNKWHLPTGDSFVKELREKVFPQICRDGLEIAGLMVRGAASPEGPLRFNKFLGEHRVQTLLDYLGQHCIKKDTSGDFFKQVDVEDYSTLSIMMNRAHDEDYELVQSLYDKYMSNGQIEAMKRALQKERGGQLWTRLYRTYFPQLRSTRVVIFLREAKDGDADNLTNVEPDSIDIPEDVQTSSDVQESLVEEEVVVPENVEDTRDTQAVTPEDRAKTDYSRFSYVRILEDGEEPNLSDEAFYDLSGKMVFPVNKYGLPANDSFVKQLREELFPLICKDSLQLVGMMIRGAASPEGPLRFNKFLGEQRAKTLVDYLGANCISKTPDTEFFQQIDVEDYGTLCIMMKRAGDKDYEIVQSLYDKYMPNGQIENMKRALQKEQGGQLWRRLYRTYLPQLRSARVVIFLRDPYDKAQETKPYEPQKPIDGGDASQFNEITDSTAVDTLRHLVVPRIEIRQPRRELLAVKTNVLFDVAYMPGYDRWCPIPNVALEYFPKHGHFTFGASLDLPWWQDYDGHKYFQVRNWQLETRYYFRSGDIRSNPPGEGAAFRGLYLQAYVHTGVFGICFDADHGWVGEGGGAGIGAGYMMPLSRNGHWRLEFALQAGFFTCKYDPYQYENPVDPNYHDNLYYYKWTLLPELFKERQYRFNWIGPTRIGVTLSYDLLYRRQKSKIPSFIPHEPVVIELGEPYEVEGVEEAENE